MCKSYFISQYKVTHHSYKNIHSAGPDIYFYEPCIGYIKKGNAKFLYKGNTIYANEGDLIYIASETRYGSIWFGSPDIEWYSINFAFNSKYAFHDYRFQILKNYPCELFERLYETHEKNPMKSISYFYLLLDDIYKKLEATTNTVPYITVEVAIEYIENNYNQNISVATLAELCHCSESGFFKLFKKSTGVTPIAYKHNIMIQHALDLLSHTTLSIEEISIQVGFSSSNYFRKIFIRITGKTPKELRRK